MVAAASRATTASCRGLRDNTYKADPLCAPPLPACAENRSEKRRKRPATPVFALATHGDSTAGGIYNVRWGQTSSNSRSFYIGYTAVGQVRRKPSAGRCDTSRRFRRQRHTPSRPTRRNKKNKWGRNVPERGGFDQTKIQANTTIT